jgi:hypothetical protein
MTGATHRAGGALAGVIGFSLLKSHGLLIDGVNEWTQLIIMYPFAVWGSIASDLDHHWQSSPIKDGFGWFFNKILHLTTGVCKKFNLGKHNPLQVFNAKHRSWQTHSDLAFCIILLLLFWLMQGAVGLNLTAISISLLSLVTVGIGIGLTAHLVLDMLTPSGIWFVSFMFLNRILGLIFRSKRKILPEKVRFVPNTEFFATGKGWESLIHRLLVIGGVLSVGWVIYNSISSL